MCCDNAMLDRCYNVLCQEDSNILNDNGNNLRIAYHSVKKGLYTWHSKGHPMSVDFSGHK